MLRHAHFNDDSFHCFECNRNASEDVELQTLFGPYESIKTLSVRCEARDRSISIVQHADASGAITCGTTRTGPLPCIALARTDAFGRAREDQIAALQSESAERFQKSPSDASIKPVRRASSSSSVTSAHCGPRRYRWRR
ncbi:hypothetical protein [Caballeronia hypogeia]|uniref:hypothetical protein n=1 Tax=Caballeronia hypogeia TaxID=1777140 RepID=UPI0012FD3C3B|nr:hypothetical protein [Caballeronia hypogeia]